MDSTESLSAPKQGDGGVRVGVKKSAGGETQAYETDRVIEGDCIAVMNAMPEGVADLVFADPP